MKIFITGITGLLGGHIAALCHAEGHEITALIRGSSISKTDFSFDLEIFYGDVTDLTSLPENLSGCDIVVNCAADTNMISIKNRKQEKVNINGLQNLITVSKKANIKRFIHISTANTIMFGSQENPADESNKLKTSSSRLSYINTKIIGEEILLDEFRQNNFPVIILNPTFILGPGDSNRSSGKLIFGAIKKQIPFYPSGGKNIVDLRDVAKVVVNAFEKGNFGDNYLISNENLTYKEIFTLACNTAKVSPPKYQMPSFIGYILGFFGYLYELVFRKSLAINLKTMKISTENHFYTTEKAKNELSFSPRPAFETIIDTVNWFKNGYLQNKKS
jgi:dihydroflavonol-4-reductase